MSAKPILFAGRTVSPGTCRRVDLPVPGLPVGPELTLPCMVVHGLQPGPRAWLSAAVHGDELNGIEVIRRVLDRLDPRRMAGTVLAVPTVNVFGLLQEQRYLPDRRDLNRSFPGGPRGSLARRLAALFMETIVAGCDLGIDLHTASDSRENLPQIRADLDDPATLELARAFGAPILIHSRPRDGSLRRAAVALGVPMLVYEAGQALRFDAPAIAVGARGVLAVLHHVGVWPEPAPVVDRPRLSRKTLWTRTSRAGFARLEVQLGDLVASGQRLGAVGGPFGGRARALTARHAGVVIGIARNPVVYQGDALVHIARLEEPEGAG